MKIVQSFWSKPAFTLSPFSWNRNAGGWNNQKFHLYSWALSCLTISRYYPQLELITDLRGYDLLIDKIKLPYKKVRLDLETLKDENPILFALGKVKAYAVQTDPFIHFDSDIFLWKKLPELFTSNRLIAQNQETDFNHDILSLREIMAKFKYIPLEILRHNNSSPHRSSNAGILGGLDIEFIHKFTDRALAFALNNSDMIDLLENPSFFNIIFEQYLFTCMAKEENIEISYLFDKLSSDYSELCDFKNIYSPQKFLHLIGPYKQYQEKEMAVAERLMMEFPEYYYRINDLVNNNQL